MNPSSTLRPSHLAAGFATALVLCACGDDGTGTARFTTWGENFIETGIPADPTGEDGLVDGWSVRFEKFLVVFANIAVAGADGTVAAQSATPLLVDNVRPGPKTLIEFPELPAKTYPQVGFQIVPATAATVAHAATPADLDLMRAGGYSVYVAGSATHTDAMGTVTTKTFAWGFTEGTQYTNCRQATETGVERAGLVVSGGAIEDNELTTHGDHFFYDRLRASATPALPTRLRFQALANADADADGAVTMTELFAAPLDVTLYDPSGLGATNMGAFLTALSRTIGHFRGEGECTVGPL